jgi:predicted TIM-barrel fold metal-dependent hydrolase
MREQTSLATPITVDQYHPKSMVRLKETEVLRARYPAIDAHNHFSDQMDVEKVIANMDACNIRTYIDLSGWNGDRLKRRLELVKGRYPERFAVFYVPDFKRVSEPEFGERSARELEEAVRNGAQGLKIYKELGLWVRDAAGKLLHVDDRRLSPLWQSAGELDVPVMIHVADPHAFFQPLDAHNERYAQLIRHPDWHFYGQDYPPLVQLLEERDRIVAEHPQTRFIGAHVGSDAENLDRASQALDRYPNYFVDFSARVGELGRQPRRARAFFLQYQDRILFGTDGHDHPVMYRSYFRFLETDDECFEYYMYPQHGFWQISALDLPDEVLWKLYVANPARVIPGITVPAR